MTTIETQPPSLSYVERLWNAGQEHLVMGRYVAARRELEAAEAAAWRQRDCPSLARIYLPLLEVRRQIRQNATDGVIMITPPRENGVRRKMFNEFIARPSGTLLTAATPVGSISYAAARTGACLEGLLLMEHAGHVRLCSSADPHFAAGLDVRVTRTAGDVIKPDVLADMVVPLPPPRRYEPGDPLHAVARESLVIAWEALALKWQARHPARAEAWEEIAWLRLALRIDPANEPITMRLIALAEAIARKPSVQPRPI
jgi:hypothetical protein